MLAYIVATLFPVCPADKARIARTRAMIAASQRWLR